ncbi:MAG: TM2 domain-containing protein [Ekhidna sp.]
MKKLLAIALLVTAGFASQAATSSYFVDDSKIESVLEASETVVFSTENLSFDQSVLKTNAGDDKIIALVLNYFVGWIGIHRLYLGGKGGLVLTYFITCGGIFGIVPLVDFFVILLGDFDSYIGNDKFIVWAG